MMMAPPPDGEDPDRDYVRPSEDDLEAAAAAMRPVFKKHRRGESVTIAIAADDEDEVWFQVTHGDPLRRNETINEGPYIGMPARTLKLTVNSSTLGFYYGYRVWRVSYTLTHKKENWLYRVLDMGPFYIDNNQNPPEVPFKVGNPERLVSGFLTPQGGKSDVPTIKEFRTFEETNFGTFLRLE